MDDFLHFATQRHHVQYEGVPLVASPARGSSSVSLTSPSAVDATAARNEIASAVGALRLEVEKRARRIDIIKREIAEKKTLSDEQRRKKQAEVAALQEEAFTRLRMLGTLGVSDQELDALQENRFTNYVRERAEHR